ncbi:hypothetical protein F5051DRAFT_377134, partial [Lentinula edodes]
MASLFPPNHGPLLPNFSSLLVKGPYPSACPLNLALSFPNPDRSIIILACSSRENSGNSLRASLQGLKLTGKISAQTERMKIFYPPTAAHMALLLSSLQVIDTDKPFPFAVHDTPTTNSAYSPHLLKPPGPLLVIIHELSAYFIDSTQPSSTSSSYLSLLARALSVTSRLGASIAIFDAHVNHLKMPVHLDSNPHLERLQAVAPLLENYIEHVLDFSDSNQPSRKNMFN